MKRCIPMVAIIILMTNTFILAAGCTSEKPADSHQIQTPAADPNTSPLEQIFAKMNEVAKNLKTCQAEIKFTTIQDPNFQNSRTIQTGTLYYADNVDNRNRLRIHFRDRKQDDFEPEKLREEYLFDGVWLTRINFKLEQIDKYQKAPEDAPIGVFELIEANFPIIGFSGTKTLEKDFDIELQDQDIDSLVYMILTPKKDSKFGKDYKKIEFRLDKTLYLPAKITSYSTLGDIYEVLFSDVKVNKKLENTVFTIETPDSFSKNIGG